MKGLEEKKSRNSEHVIKDHMLDFDREHAVGL